MRFSKFWNTFPQSVGVDGLNLLAYSVFDLFDYAGCIFVHFALQQTPPPKERSRQASDRLPHVSNFLTNFWMQHFDGARLSPNSVRNSVWHALNEPVCRYLRTRNPRCSTVYIDNSLGPLARDSPCINQTSFRSWQSHTNLHMSKHVATPYCTQHIRMFITQIRHKRHIARNNRNSVWRLQYAFCTVLYITWGGYLCRK
jgi:hypothetical protein